MESGLASRSFLEFMFSVNEKIVMKPPSTHHSSQPLENSEGLNLHRACMAGYAYAIKPSLESDTCSRLRKWEYCCCYCTYSENVTCFHLSPSGTTIAVTMLRN